MTEKRFVKVYCCGDTGLLDKEKEEWFVENLNSIFDLERNWNDVLDKLNEVADESEQLKRELTKFKEWKKHIGDVKREELDRVFKMSIYEIAGAFEYYEERIKKLEEELQEWSDEDESCGHCKHLQIDGMFGMWCDKGRNWQNTDANYCSDYER